MMSSVNLAWLLRHSRVLAMLVALAVLFVTGGCSLMPTSGPSPGDVRAGQRDPNSLPYALVRLTPEVERVLGAYAPRLSGLFSDRRPQSPIHFGPGDSLNITIFEAAAGGLFVPLEAGVRPGNFVTLPTQQVDPNGNVTVPFAGAIPARGRTPAQVEASIVDALKDRAIEPQAVVALADQKSSLISVNGEVKTPSRFPARYAQERLLDVIARAGGPRFEPYDLWVMVERGGKQVTIPFGALLLEPDNNIPIHPEDEIYVYRENQTFLAFGATGAQGQFNFDNWRISLAEAVGKAGGLFDTRAEPASVFLYRAETRDVAEKLGIDCSQFGTLIIPVVYVVNFRDPAGFHLAQRFQMRNKDVLYVANADTVQAAKAMEFFRLVVATVNDPIAAANNAVVLRNTIKAGTGVIGGEAAPQAASP
jgi:polysaccharide export outer membrane protein